MNYGLVAVPIGSLMKEPNVCSGLEDETIYGMKVAIEKEAAPGWFQVKTHYRYEGIMRASSLVCDEGLIREWEQKEKSVIIKSYADVLSGPKIQAPRLLSLPYGAQVINYGLEGDSDFCRVGLVDGSCGYVKSGFLGKWQPSMYEDRFAGFETEKPEKARIQDFLTTQLHTDEETFRNALVKTALDYLKTQYRWGGKTSLGIDCSGLVSMAYMLNGLIIYRDAKIVDGFPVHAIDFNDKKPGDLLLFPGHVAMYIGDDRYVHSTNKKGSDGVVINSLNPSKEGYREDLLKLITQTGSVF